MTAVLTNSEPNNHPDAGPRIHSAGQRARSRTRGWVKRSLISLAGLLGAIAIVVTIAPFFGWTVVRLASGSMAPGFPTDSLLITHAVPAADVVPGEIVMVQRVGELPITHRVVTSEAAGVGLRKLTLRGDANAATDASPYTVRNVGLVVAGLPWGGQIVAALRSTIGLGALTILATLVVLWAWWPAARVPRHSHRLGAVRS